LHKTGQKGENTEICRSFEVFQRLLCKEKLGKKWALFLKIGFPQAKNPRKESTVFGFPCLFNTCAKANI
jgi:hypothetical protein